MDQREKIEGLGKSIFQFFPYKFISYFIWGFNFY